VKDVTRGVLYYSTCLTSGQIEHSFNQISHWHVVTLETEPRRVDECLRVQMLPGEAVIGVQRELTQEGALGPSVALSEGMHCVDLGIV
jgi:hypothetical protein